MKITINNNGSSLTCLSIESLIGHLNELIIRDRDKNGKKISVISSAEAKDILSLLKDVDNFDEGREYSIRYSMRDKSWFIK